jgi:hypothetical protein
MAICAASVRATAGTVPCASNAAASESAFSVAKGEVVTSGTNFATTIARAG